MEPAYDFGPLLERIRTNPWRADPLLRSLLRDRLPAEATAALERFGGEVAGPLWEAADAVDRADALPALAPFDPYRRREDRVSLPARTSPLWAATFGRGMAAPEAEPARDFARFAHIFLLAQLGEVGTVCPIACTDGLVRVLERYPTADGGAAGRTAVAQVRASTPERMVSGAQLVTEIHAGSDAARVALDARLAPAGRVTLDGAKWFCSNVTAEYWVVLARVAGSDGETVLVLVDRGEAGPQVRIDRLKDKLGTRALATAEVSFDGAPGTLVGERGRGLAIVVGTVLTTSRVYTVVGSAAYAVMAARIARAWASFRSAFGRRLEELPLVRAEVDALVRDAATLAAGAFATLERWLRLLNAPAPPAPEARAGRLLVELAKRRTSARATQIVHRAIMVLGGNGIEERFSPLPRLLRDAIINETWEGPHTLLAAQAHKDLSRWQRDGGAAGEVLETLLAGATDPAPLRDATMRDLAGSPGPGFAAHCDALYDAFAAAAFARVG